MSSGAGARAGISAVVVTYNSEAVLPAFLQALPEAFGSLPYELIVADNNSADASVALVGRYAPDARVVPSDQNLGYSGGINRGLQSRTLGGPILVLNPDVRLAPGAVRALLGGLDVPGTGIAVPRFIAPDGHTQFSLRRDPTVLRAWGEALLGGDRAGRFEALGEVVNAPSAYEVPSAPDWATGAVMLISAECAAAVGTWDERFFLYSEETDFAIRARSAGFQLRYVPGASAVHIGGESNTSPLLWSLLVRNRIRLYRKYHGPVATAPFAAGVFVNEALRAAAGRSTNRAALRSLVRSGPHPLDRAP